MTLTEATDITDFLSAAEARTDCWRQLATIGRTWEAAGGTGEPTDTFSVAASRLFAEIAPLESYWAYPGRHLTVVVAQTIEEGNAAVFTRLVQKIAAALLNGACRYDGAFMRNLDVKEIHGYHAAHCPKLLTGAALERAASAHRSR